MTFYFENYLRDVLKDLKRQIRTIEKKFKKVEKTVREEVELTLFRAERSARLSVAKLADTIEGHLEEIPPLIDEAFTVDTPQKAAKMAEIYGEELAMALYDTQLRIDAMQHSIIRAAAPLAQAVVPVVNTAVKSLTVLANTVGKLMGAFVQSAFGIKVYEHNLKSALQTTASIERFLAGFDQIERIGSAGSGLSGLLVPDTQQVIPGWEALAEKIRQMLEPLKQIDFSPAIAQTKNALKALQPVLQAALQALEWGWYNLLVPLADWAAETVLPAFLQALTTGFQTLGQVIQQVQPVLTWLWENFFQKLAQWYAEQILSDIQALAEKFRAMGDNVKEYIPTLQFLLDKLGGILDLVQALRTRYLRSLFRQLLPSATAFLCCRDLWGWCWACSAHLWLYCRMWREALQVWQRAHCRPSRPFAICSAVCGPSRKRRLFLLPRMAQRNF